MAGYNIRILKYKHGTQVRIYNDSVGYSDIVKSVKAIENRFVPLVNSDSLLDDPEGVDCDGRSLGQSVSRSKQAIFRIARSNEWEWFFTLTFDPKVVDARDYGVVSAKLSNWIRNIKQRFAPDMKYIFVPEYFADREKLHFHGLVSCIGDMPLQDSGKVAVGKKAYDAADCPFGDPVYNLPKWKFGFTTATKIRDSKRAAGYIVKYITKDLGRLTKNKRRYLFSLNLDQPDEMRCRIVSEDLRDMLERYKDGFAYVKTVNPGYGKKVMYIEIDEKENNNE